MWQDYTNALLGFAVLLVAFLQLSDSALTWMLSVLGAAIMIMGLWHAIAMSKKSEIKHA